MQHVKVPHSWRLPGLLTLLFIIGVGCSPTYSGSANVPTKKVAAPAFTLTDIKGNKFSLEDFRGKIVFLEFWATWCPPCVISMPEVDNLTNAYAGKDVVFLSVSVDQSEEPVRNFLKRKPLSSRVALAGDSGIDLRYRVGGIPMFFLIDKEGNVAASWDGYSGSYPRQWRTHIDRLLKA